MTTVGSFGLVWIALAPLLAAWTRRRALAVTAIAAGSVWLTDLLTTALKALIDRPRPPAVLPQADPLVETATSASMPSGHASTSFAGAVILAFFVKRALPALLALAALIAFSRVYVGVHYPLDVLAGAGLGTAIALAVRAALKARRRISEDPRRLGARPTPG